MSKGRTKTCECPHRGMGKTVGDLTLDDEHMSVGVDDTLQEAAKRLLTISGGIVVVLGDEHRVKGVIGQRQLIKALSQGVDASAVQCHQHMEMDFMQVRRSDDLKTVLADIQQRSPQAVVAVDENDEFIGYFSPGDYQEAVQLVENLKDLSL
ncbi:MAG TPA: CBS domain-containing protein [Candidatus Poseidoniales archaeon]|nr:MAG TPA: CBS domain-containing protein [Candidatus Poseidoniales archaeon]